MLAIYPISNKKINLNITITCTGKKVFRVWAEELDKPNSVYAARQIEVDNSRTIYFSFPVSPKKLYFGCINLQNPSDTDFDVKIEEAPLNKYNIWVDEPTRKFMQLAVNFSQMCGFTPPSKKGTIYSSKDKIYKIKHVPTIIDPLTGKELSTPARIGHQSGQMEASAVKLNLMTIPMRTIISFHEFCHKYKNPKIGLQIGNESGADINALYLYLGEGFSKVDAIVVFGQIFYKADTDENVIRMRKILKYIQQFENGEFAEKTKM